jgi:putative redox protein
MADAQATVRWTGEGLRFTGGRPGGPEVELDGSGGGLSPVTALLLGVGGCMAVDIVDIGTKMRLPITGVAVELEADRRAEPPRRLTAVRMRFVVEGVGPGEQARVQRAVDLSRDTYCSVLHPLREDIAISIELELR